MRIARGLVAGIAVAFGIATIVAGTRVLAGADPGYLVFRPLLLFNTVMGLAYIGAGALAWRSPARGRTAAGTILGVNLLVLGAIVYLHRTGGPVAPDSVRAMTFRSAVWFVLLVALAWMVRRDRLGSGDAPPAP
jgi:hypothetical protein